MSWKKGDVAVALCAVVSNDQEARVMLRHGRYYRVRQVVQAGPVQALIVGDDRIPWKTSLFARLEAANDPDFLAIIEALRSEKQG